jgi:hypothetical protein
VSLLKKEVTELRDRQQDRVEETRKLLKDAENDIPVFLEGLLEKIVREAVERKVEEKVKEQVFRHLYR